MSPSRVAYLAELAAESGSTMLEGALARAFVLRHHEDYDDFDFQKHVGHGTLPPPEVDQSLAPVWFHATRRRVDVVGYRAAGVDLVEVKDEITWPALAQLCDYLINWKLAPQKPEVADLIVIGRSIDAGIGDRAAALGIRYELFPDVGV